MKSEDQKKKKKKNAPNPKKLDRLAFGIPKKLDREAFCWWSLSPPKNEPPKMLR